MPAPVHHLHVEPVTDDFRALGADQRLVFGASAGRGSGGSASRHNGCNGIRRRLRTGVALVRQRVLLRFDGQRLWKI